ncbi:hypothetical protein CKA32_006708 [Geitlerinema sp. FC II]|nr:hypothetical protein CKA32_006708 [Geitlerinema sp. FC II]
MPSPFPGMNPYLEHPDFWVDFHNRLVVALADALVPPLLPKYFVDIKRRIYEISDLDWVLFGEAEAAVPDSQNSRTPSNESVTIAERATDRPYRVTLPVLEEVRESYLEVRDAVTKEVVTAIELLSPTNKRGEGRQKYLQKRQKVLGSQTNFIEIDLLRGGEPMPILERSFATPYRILVSRAQTRPTADLYAFGLSDRIPVFPLPLRPEDKEPEIDLQSLLHQVCDRAGYEYFLNYTELELFPNLSEAEFDSIKSFLD